VLAEAQSSNSSKVNFPSFAAALYELGLTARTNNRNQLEATFALWRRLSITYDCWYDRKNGRQTRTLPPPFAQIRYPGNQVFVSVNAAWVELLRYTRGYNVRIPLPLPPSAAAQNATLMVLTAVSNYTADDLQGTAPVRQSGFARKIGLSRKNRRRRLHATLKAVESWFEQMGGEVMLIVGGEANADLIPRSKLRFIRKMPAPRWRPKAGRNAVQKNGPKRSRSTSQNRPKGSLGADPNVAAGAPKTDPNIEPIMKSRGV
jgi:hypothetical protein